MPKFDDEQELLNNLRQYAKDGLLSAGYTSDGLEKIRLEIISGTVVFCPLQTPKYGIVKSNLSFLVYQFIKNLEIHHQPLDDYYCLTHFDVKIDDDNLYSPTMLIEKITPENNTNDIYYLQKPQIIFEILTNKNKHLLNAKFEHYQTIATLQEYVLIDLDSPQIWLCQRDDDWQAVHYNSNQDFVLKSIDCWFRVADIYLGI